MNNFINRHDASKKSYWKIMENSKERRSLQISRIEKKSSYIDFALQNLEMDANKMLAIDPDATKVLTWDAWTTYMQVAEALFAVSTAPPGSTVERLINREVRILEAVHPGSSVNAENWLKAFFLAVSCRDNDRAHFLCTIPAESLREWGESGFQKYDSYIYPWIEAIQDLMLGRPDLDRNLYSAMNLTEHESVRVENIDYVDYVVFPQIDSLYRLSRFNTDKFGSVFHQGLLFFSEFYSQNEECRKSLSGVVPLGLVAIGCMAYDAAEKYHDFDFEINSDYLPKAIIKQSWRNSYPI